MQIHSLVIYSRDGRQRELVFNLNGVSIIAGDSATGKSSLIEIVDYCLGSKECRVPDGTIRETVAWYALKLVQENGGQIFVARRVPDTDQRSTHQFFIVAGKSVRIPASNQLRMTHNLNDAIATLSEFLGIRPNETQSEEESGNDYNITIRHAIKFCLQYQDEIASKRTLFHQQGESFKAKSIYDSLPYLLGFQQDDYLERLAHLKQAKKDLAEAQRRVTEYDALAAGGLDIGRSLLGEAVQVGILKSVDLPATPELLLRTLEFVLEWTPETVPADNASDDTLTAAQQSLVRHELHRQELKARVLAAESTTELIVETRTEWEEQVARLTSAQLFRPAEASESFCPLCEQPTAERDAALPQVRSVRQQFEETTEQLSALTTGLPDINKYLDGLREELRQTDSSITSTHQTIRQLQRDRDQNGAILNLTVRQAIVVGHIQQYLVGMRDRLGDGTTLRKARDSAERRVRDLEAGISTEETKGQLRSVADQLQGSMTTWASELQLEFAPEPFRINFEQLTVEVSRSGYHLPLYRMGSGKNWLGCHLLAHFAMHSYFIAKRRPVPRLLFLDQPTQVFYPPDDVDRAGGEVKDLKVRETGQSEDRNIVQRIFDWIFQQTKQFNKKGRFQVIITDHAELNTPEFRAARIDKPRWRTGVNSLVPPDWLKS
jgi:flagellar motility protein MotE (MotC chaperone)